MKVMTIGIKGEKDAMRDFERAFEAASARTPFQPVKGVSFTSLEAVRNFLTPKRMALIHLIKENSPRSLYALAKLARRSFPSVLKDISVLSKHGLVTLAREKASPRRALQPSVGYSAIHLWIGV